MASDYAKTLGARLRAIRTQQGLSLHGVEEKSRGRWKAVVVGSYERGDRSVTVQKLAELAEFYGVPVSELLPGDATPTPLVPSPKLVIDLERMGQLPKDKVGPLARDVAPIQSQRGDYNGRVLSVRHEDLRSLAVIYDKSPADLTEELISWGVLDAAARGASGDCTSTPSAVSASERNVSASRSRSSASRADAARGRPASAAARLPAPAAKKAAHSVSARSTCGSSSQTLCGLPRLDLPGSPRAATTAAAARSAARWAST